MCYLNKYIAIKNQHKLANMLNAFFVNIVINAAVHFETNIRYLLNYNKTIKHEISISYNT